MKKLLLGIVLAAIASCNKVEVISTMEELGLKERVLSPNEAKARILEKNEDLAIANPLEFFKGDSPSKVRQLKINLSTSMCRECSVDWANEYIAFTCTSLVTSAGEQIDGYFVGVIDDNEFAILDATRISKKHPYGEVIFKAHSSDTRTRSEGERYIGTYHVTADPKQISSTDTFISLLKDPAFVFECVDGKRFFLFNDFRNKVEGNELMNVNDVIPYDYFPSNK